MLIIYSLGKEPVKLVQFGAKLDGLLLTPLQAIVVGWVLYKVMPTFFAPEHRKALTPGPLMAIGLASAFLIFGFICVYKMGEMF